MFFLDILISNIFNFWNGFIKKVVAQEVKKWKPTTKRKCFKPTIQKLRWYKNLSKLTKNVHRLEEQNHSTYACFPRFAILDLRLHWYLFRFYKAKPTLIGKTRVTLLTRLDHWRFPAHAFWTVYWVYIKYLLNLSIISITINNNHNIVVFVVVVYSTKENFIFPFSLPFFFNLNTLFF